MGHQLSFFGLGKLGLPLAALFARNGVPTIGIDTNAALIARLKAAETPYVEPGLAELLEEAAPSITYTTDAQAAAATDATIILVPTPSTPSAPEFSIEYVVTACNALAAALKTRPSPRYHLIVIASTVMPGTVADRITPLLEQALGQRAGPDFGVAYVPDFVAPVRWFGVCPGPPISSLAATTHRPPRTRQDSTNGWLRRRRRSACFRRATPRSPRSRTTYFCA